MKKTQHPRKASLANTWKAQSENIFKPDWSGTLGLEKKQLRSIRSDAWFVNLTLMTFTGLIILLGT